MIKKFLVATVFFIVPLLTHANVWITEIHYNPEGSDSGNEWIEIFNGGSQTVTVSSYKFRENDVNHSLKTHGETDDSLEPGEYAVVADKPENFIIRYPSYAGKLFDSSFSLKNTGEQLQMVNSDSQVVFEVTYSDSTGGGDNGHSIGLMGDVWNEVYASPGALNVQVPGNTSTASETDSTSDQSTDETTLETQESTNDVAAPATYIEIKDPTYEAKKIKVSAGPDRTVMAGVEHWFDGEVYGLQGGVLNDPEVRWNWGDGSKSIGTPASHRYLYPGTYTLSMSAVSGKYSARDMVTVRVIAPALELSSISISEETISIENNSNYILEISGYRLIVGDQVFEFPPDSFISAGSKLVLPKQHTGLSFGTNEQVMVTDGTGQIITSINTHESLSGTLESQVALKMEETVSVLASRENTRVSQTIVRPTQSVSQSVTQPNNPTHSVVYVENLSALGDEEGEGVETIKREKREIVVGTQDARLSGGLPQERSAWVEILLLGIVVLVGLSMYVVERMRSKKEEDRIYDVLD